MLTRDLFVAANRLVFVSGRSSGSGTLATIDIYSS